MQEKVTIVVPTKNRSHFLEKLFQYHAKQNFKGTILIGDASEGVEYAKNQESVRRFSAQLNIGHFQQPATSLIGSVNLLLKETTTPYAVLAGDDDFLVPSALANCADFLDKHPDYSCACGQQAYVHIVRQAGTTFEIQGIEAGYSKNQENPSPSKRIVQYCTPARGNNTFSVQRTAGMHYCWQTASDLHLDRTKYHIALHEIAVNVMSLIQGKQIKFPQLYHVMLRHIEKEETFQGRLSWLERMSTWDWGDEIQKLIAWWSEALVEKEGLNPKQAKDISEAVFMQCWLPVMIGWRDNLLRRNDRTPKFAMNSKEYLMQWLKGKSWARNAWNKIRSGQKLSLDQFMDKRSIYYNDFLPIREILSEVS